MQLKKSPWLLFLILGLGIFLVVACELPRPLEPTTSVRNLALPGPADILIFAPHPDDESLAFGGVILQALARGQHVQVVTFTNGDGFSQAAATLYKKPVAALNASDMRELGRVRQAEELAAMAVLGLEQTEVTFLGYPDGGLSQVYQTPDDQVYTHDKTRQSRTYGLCQADYHTMAHGLPADYRKASVLADLIELIERVAPGQLYVTNPVDTHPDHRASFWFVRDAIRRSGYQGRLNTAVIHAGAHSAWPLPSGATPTQAFEPPPLFKERGIFAIAWPPPLKLPLTQEQAMLKLKAIQAHRSQLQLGTYRRYFESFIKNEEIFWPVTP